MRFTVFRLILLRFLPRRVLPVLTVIELVRLGRRAWHLRRGLR